MKRYAIAILATILAITGSVRLAAAAQETVTVVVQHINAPQAWQIQSGLGGTLDGGFVDPISTGIAKAFGKLDEAPIYNCTMVIDRSFWMPTNYGPYIKVFKSKCTQQ